MPKTYHDLQPYFNDAVAFFGTMNCRSADGDTCVYLNTSTKDRCIIGQFLPQGHDAEVFEGNVEDVILQYEDLIGIAIPYAHNGLEFANHLQAIHDDKDNWLVTVEDGYLVDHGFIGWKSLAALADRYGLEYTQPVHHVEVSETVGV